MSPPYPYRGSVLPNGEFADSLESANRFPHLFFHVGVKANKPLSPNDFQFRVSPNLALSS